MNGVCLKLSFVGLGGSPTPKLHSSAPPPPPSLQAHYLFFVSCKCCINILSFFQQIGRASSNDIVVHSEVNKAGKENSRISRYSCRILVDREQPHTAYLFAAGFDKFNNIFLGVCKPAICLYLKYRICSTETILSHVTALKGRFLTLTIHSYILYCYLPKGPFQSNDYNYIFKGNTLFIITNYDTQHTILASC